ncbi:hypothetical protein HZS_56 [Henneguya salminicola]|nr:hypothetical protein HZS_56 [Henneguya salminicola]
MSDRWSTYHQSYTINNLIHMTLNHSLNLVDRTTFTFAHTQNIESFWAKTKLKITRMKGICGDDLIPLNCILTHAISSSENKEKDYEKKQRQSKITYGNQEYSIKSSNLKSHYYRCSSFRKKCNATLKVDIKAGNFQFKGNNICKGAVVDRPDVVDTTEEMLSFLGVKLYRNYIYQQQESGIY